MEEYLISIIIPVYNAERYLENCLNSVINQTYSKLEIILVNDGSTDNSVEICEKYEKKDNRIKVFNQQNKGGAAARNFGILNSKGKFISFIDSDDWVDNRYIEILYNNIVNLKADLSVCGYQEVSNKSDIDIKYSINADVKELNKKQAYELLVDNEFGGFLWRKDVF